MNKVFYILLIMLAIFLCSGLYNLIVAKASFYARIVGVVYLGICLVILFKTNLSVEYIEEEPFRYEQLQSLHKQPGNKQLHELVVDSVLPESKKYIGIVVATIADGKTDITGFGKKSLSHPQIPRNDTLFEIGSLSKLYTASLISMAIEKNKLNLDKEVYELIDASNKFDEDKKSITIEHLVTHSSGLPRMSWDAYRPVQIWKSVSGRNPYSIYSHEKMRDIFAAVRLKDIPGSDIRYSNTGYGLLGYILSEQAKTPYEKLLHKGLGAPLDLTDTVVHLSRNQSERLAQGYQGYLRLGGLFLTQKSEPWAFAPGMVGAGGLRSTARDMLLFLKANLDQKDQAPVNRALKMSHNPLHESEGSRIGMGWFIGKLPESEKEFLFHSGLTGGYSSFIGFTSDYRFGVVILANTSRSLDSMGQAVLNNFKAFF